MLRSDEFFQPDQPLREAGETLRPTLFQHFGKLIQDLTHNLEAEMPLHSSEETVDPKCCEIGIKIQIEITPNPLTILERRS